MMLGLPISTNISGVIKPERVINGTFDSNVSGWSPFNSTLSWVSPGRARVTGTGINPTLAREVPVTPGYPHRARATLVATTGAGNKFLKIGTTITGNTLGQQQSASLITFEVTFTPVTPTVWVSCMGSSISVSGDTFDWDNVSVRRV